MNTRNGEDEEGKVGNWGMGKEGGREEREGEMMEVERKGMYMCMGKGGREEMKGEWRTGDGRKEMRE